MAIISGLTIDDFEKLPDALALNHELVDGELVDVSRNTGIFSIALIPGFSIRIGELFDRIQ
jgi:hypothetical protein